MRMMTFAKRCAKEILRDPINLGFGLGFRYTCVTQEKEILIVPHLSEITNVRFVKVCKT